MATNHLIEVTGLVKCYGDFALDHVSFTVDEGEIVGFVGKNGAGKSTTIKALLGLMKLDGGEARLLGHVFTPSSSSEEARVREQVGVVFDTVSLPPHLKLKQVARLHAHAFTQWDQAMFDKLTQQFSLPVDKRVSELSRGMGMKLSLACALSHHPCVLLLDEATAGLDPMVRDEVLDLVREFVARPGHAVLMSDHITSDLEKVADRVVGIDAGRIIFDKTKDEICDGMGVAHCRVAEFERVMAEGIIAEREARYLKRDFGIDLMVPDRFSFIEAFPEIPCDRMTIDEYLSFILKGGVR